MSRIWRVLASIGRWLGTAGVAFCAATLVLMLALTVYEAVVRYAFHARTVYAVEMGEYFMIIISFLSGAYVLRNDRHIRMDLLYLHLRPRARIVFDIVIDFLCLAFCVILFRTGYNLAATAYYGGARSSTVLLTPLAPVYAVFPLSALLMGLQYAVTLGNRVKGAFARGG